MWSISTFMKPDEISSLELVLVDEKVFFMFVEETSVAASARGLRRDYFSSANSREA
ncbi:hypothetical protein A2U01_0093387, partial [Trifolium medium]|nr:hypothetical protein [Trifolium medium]